MNIMDDGKNRYKVDKFYAQTLENNPLNSPVERYVHVYLPPDYYTDPGARYPVVYFLHGYSSNYLQVAIGREANKFGDMLPPEIKPGVSGRAEIVITNLSNVLAVPIQAVTSVKGEQVCFVGRGASPRKTQVEVGLYNDKFIEIKTGLKEGDELLLAPLLAESDEIDLSGSIVAANEYEADRKAAAGKKRKTSGKGAGASEKPVVPKPPTPLETLQQPLKDLRRAAQPLEPPMAAVKQTAVRGAPGAPSGRGTNAVSSAGSRSVQLP